MTYDVNCVFPRGTVQRTGQAFIFDGAALFWQYRGISESDDDEGAGQMHF
jgi:hypothetical protein